MSDIIALLKKGLAANPTDWKIRKGVLEQLAKAGDSAQLAEVVNDAPELPEDEQLAQEVAGIVAGADSEVGHSFVGKLVEKFPASSWMHGAMAKLCVAQGDLEGAGTHYSAAKTFDPSYSDSSLEELSGLFGGGEEEAAPEASGITLDSAPEAPAIEEVAPMIEEAAIEPMAQVEELVEEPVMEPAIEMAAPSIIEESIVEEVVEEVVEELPAEPEYIAPVVEEAVAPIAEPELEIAPITPVADLEAAPIDAPAVRPLVDPSSVPEAPALNIDEVEEVADLNFTSMEELEMTRSHLLVVTPEGDELDADNIEEAAVAEESETPTLLGVEGGEIPQIAQEKDTKEKVSAIITTILVHVALFFLLYLIVIAAPRILPPEIVASPGPVSNEQTVTKKNVVQQQVAKPPAPSANVMKTISAVSSSPVSVPSVDFTPPDDPVELGSTFGNVGFGTTGSSTGGNISFMGMSGSGSRVVFAVDMSLSMGKFPEGKEPTKEMIYPPKGGKKAQKHQLLREELTKSIKKLPQGTQYQIVMFSQWAWAHDQMEDEWLQDDRAWGKQGSWFRDQIENAGINSKGKAGGFTLDDFSFPKMKYLSANPTNTKRSIEIIERTPTTLGTNWENPVLTALSISPRPDIVFFLTDGSVNKPEKAMELIAEKNKAKRTIIHTTAMMVPAAAVQLNELAQQNGGKFTIVEQDGSITKGEEFFKGK